MAPFGKHLTHFSPIFPFDPLKNIFGFLVLSGWSKGSIGKKRINLLILVFFLKKDHRKNLKVLWSFCIKSAWNAFEMCRIDVSCYILVLHCWESYTFLRLSGWGRAKLLCPYFFSWKFAILLMDVCSFSKKVWENSSNNFQRWKWEQKQALPW